MNNKFDIVVGVRLSDSKVNEDLKNIQNLVNKKDLSLNLKFNDSDLVRQINNIDRNFSNVNNTVKNVNSSILNSVSSLARFTVASTVLYGTYKQLGEMVSYISEQNTKMVNIAMVGGYSLDQVKDLVKGYSDLAGQLHSTNKEILDAAENFLRAGNSVQASKNLIKASAIGSAISGQTNDQTSEQLIAISNGFKMNTEDGKALLSVIDQISTADNKSATSFAEISTAMRNCSNSAQTAKVDLTHLVAYLSTVESVTRKNASSIGESFKAQFARYENVRGGKNFDETGDLSNVERDLQKYADIKIRSDVGTFKSYSETIDTLKSKWSSLNEVSRAAISKAMAGTTHAEDFQALMNNMDKVDGMLKDLGNSAGSAEKKFNELYSDSTKAHIADMKHAQEELFESFMDSKELNSAIDGLTHFLNTLQILTTTEKSSAVELAAVSASIILLIKNFTKLNTTIELFTVLSKGVGVTNTLTATMSALGTSIAKSGASLLAFATNPVTLAIMGMGVLAGVIIRNVEHQRQLKQETDQLKTSYESLTTAMKENNIESLKSNSGSLEKEQKNLQDLIKKQTEAKKLLDEATEKYNKNPTTGNENALIKTSTTYDAITKKIKEQEKAFKDAGVSFETLANAKNQLANNGYINKIKEETDIQVNHNNQLISQIQEYQNLNNVENKNATQKARMSQLANELSSNVKDLTVAKDKDGNITIQNTSLLSKSIDMLNSENSTVQTSAKVKMESAKQNAQWQVNETTVTYQEILKRIKLYEEEMNALNENQRKLDEIDLRIKNGTATDADKTEANNLANGLMYDGDRISRNLQAYQQAKNNLDAIYNSTSKVSDGLNKNTNELNDGYTPALNDATKASKENANAVANSKDVMRDFNLALKEVNNTIYAQELALKGLDDSSDNYRSGLQNEIKLLKEKNDMLDKGIALAKNEASSLNAKAGTTSNGVTVSNSSSGAWKGKYSNWINDAASQNQLDPILIASIIQQESSFNPNDVNSKSGATGLGQFLASTAREEGITDRKDPQQSIYGLAKYLRKRINWAGGDVWKGVRGYGEGTQEYENLIRGWYNKFSNGQMGDGGGSSSVTSSTSSLASEADSIQSTLESLEKEKLDNSQKIIELYKGIFDSKIKQFDEQLAHVDRNKDMAKTLYDIYKVNDSKDGIEESLKYKEQVWKEINWHYNVLNQKELYVSEQLKNSSYDQKTLSSMQKALEEIKIEKQNTILNLHQEFESWQEETIDIKIKVNKDNIDDLERKSSILDKISNQNYDEKININNRILDQNEQIKQKIYEQMDAVQKLISLEKDPNTLQIWINQWNKLSDQVDEIKQKELDLQQRNIELAKNNALDLIEKGIYDGKNKQEFEDGINKQINALDDELEVMQKQNDALQERETRQKNLLDIAEEQMKLQDEMNNKSVQQLTKDKNGQWNFEYVANHQNVDNLEKELRDKLKNNSDFERQTADKHKQDSLNNEKKALQDQISIRQESYDRIRNDLEEAIKNGTADINNIVETSLGNIKSKYNGKYDHIINDAQTFINNYSGTLESLNNKIKRSQDIIENINNTQLPGMKPKGDSKTVWIDGNTDSADWQTAEKYYASLGYGIKKIDKDNYDKVTKDDILLGLAGSNYGDKTNGQKVTGKDRDETERKAQADTLEKQQRLVEEYKNKDVEIEKKYGDSITQTKKDNIDRGNIIVKNAVTGETRIIKGGANTNETTIKRSWEGITNITHDQMGNMVVVVRDKVNEASAEIERLLDLQRQAGLGGGGGSYTPPRPTDVYVDGGGDSIYMSNGKTYHYDANKTDIYDYISKHKFETGGETQRTGLHWLDGNNGKPERVLSAEQTEGFNTLVYKQLPELKNIIPNLSSLISRIQTPKINFPDISNIIKNTQQSQEITQHFNIDKIDFPNVTNANDIEDALKNLPSKAKQYVNRYDK